MCSYGTYSASATKELISGVYISWNSLFCLLVEGGRLCARDKVVFSGTVMHVRGTTTKYQARDYEY